jgi:hypothetical protein
MSRKCVVLAAFLAAFTLSPVTDALELRAGSALTGINSSI